jgi:hypothetical protein
MNTNWRQRHDRVFAPHARRVRRYVELTLDVDVWLAHRPKCKALMRGVHRGAHHTINGGTYGTSDPPIDAGPDWSGRVTWAHLGSNQRPPACEAEPGVPAAPLCPRGARRVRKRGHPLPRRDFCRPRKVLAPRVRTAHLGSQGSGRGSGFRPFPSGECRLEPGLLGAVASSVSGEISRRMNSPWPNSVAATEDMRRGPSSGVRCSFSTARRVSKLPFRLQIGISRSANLVSTPHRQPRQPRRRRCF